MKNRIDATLIQWLKLLSIPVSKRFVRHTLLTHPNYPSLVSITDLLDELGIENGAYVVSRENWQDLPFPFLAYSDENGGEFLLVQEKDKRELQKGGMLENWNGIAVFAENSGGPRVSEMLKIVKAERNRTVLLTAALSILFLLGILSIIPGISLRYFLLYASSVLGLTIAILIVLKELGIVNDLVEKICGIQKDGDCDAVIQSKGSAINKWLNWADIGVIYFSAYLILLVFQNPTLRIASVCAIPFTLFSVYYQWRIVKKWCTLCLLTVSVLVVQAALVWPDLSNISFTWFGSGAIASAAFTFLWVFIVWLVVAKPLLDYRKDGEEERLRLLKFKRSPKIFESLLRTQKTIDAVSWEHDIQLGNPTASIQLLVACNPYCNPCAKAHKSLHQLIESNDNIGLTIRFTADPKKPESPAVQAVAYLIQLLKGKSIDYKRKALHDWYEWMSMNKFKEKYALQTKLDVYAEMAMHRKWAEESNVEYTPTVFINGYILPREYKPYDLADIFRSGFTMDVQTKIITNTSTD